MQNAQNYHSEQFNQEISIWNLQLPLDMKPSHPHNTQHHTNPSRQGDLIDFNKILSEQHSKHFHLIDHPDLIFELSQYKLISTKSPVQASQFPNSVSSKKISHTNKNKEQVFQKQYLLQKQFIKKNDNKNNPNLIKPDDTSQSLHQNISLKKLDKTQIQMQKIIFQIQAQKDINKMFQIHSITSENSNIKQKQNVLNKILNSQTKPSTSTALNIRAGKTQPDGKINWKKLSERKKYHHLKSKLASLIQQIQNCEDLHFSEVFEYEQLILKDYLSELVLQMKKQCVQKGQLIELIWNTFFCLINKIMEIIVEKNKKNEKIQLKQQLSLHNGYQQMYLFETEKIKELGKKYNDSKNVIDRLIFELRYKRKQVKKLYKSLAICNQRLNDYKVEHIDLQNDHIELLVDTKEMKKDEAIELMYRKIQVNKQKYLKQRVGTGKNKLKQKILRQLQEQRLRPQQEQQFRKQLFERINNAKKKKKTTIVQEKQQGSLIEEFIERYSNSCIHQNPIESQNQQSKNTRRPLRIETAINTEQDFKPKTQCTNFLTQTTFSEKIQFSLIQTRSTQTPGVQKIKKIQNVGVQVDDYEIKLLMIKAKMRMHKTLDLSFYFDVMKRDQKVKHILQARKPNLPQKRQSKKNDSIFEISSDASESTEKLKELSNNLTKQKKQHKVSIFNTTLPNSKDIKMKSNDQNIKIGPQTRIPKKKQITELSQMTNELETEKKQSSTNQFNKTKKRKFQSSQINLKSFYRSSISKSHFDSVINNIVMNQQKQKFIEDLTMNKKEQEYLIMGKNTIFTIFKDLIFQKQSKKFQASQDFRQDSIFSLIQGQPNETSNQNGLKQVESKNNKRFSCDKLIGMRRESVSKLLRQRGHKLSMGQSQMEILKSFDFKTQKQSLRRASFLNKIIEFTVCKSLIRCKIDQLNIRACKEKSQFYSITEKLDPVLRDVELILDQNSAKKRKSQNLNIKSVHKLIMMTYSRSIDKINRGSAVIQNLMRPLYECFELMYGALKPQDIYKKMVGLLSDLISLKNHQHLQQFIFFLGLDKENPYSAHLTTFDVRLYLKFLDKLNLAGKIGGQIQCVYTSEVKVTSELVQILLSENVSQEVMKLVECKIRSLLKKLGDFVREGMDSEEQNKINLFKVSRMIVEQIIKIRVDSLLKLQFFTKSLEKNQKKGQEQLNFFLGRSITKEKKESQTTNPLVGRQIKDEKMDVEPIKRVIECFRVPTVKKLYFSKYLEQLSIRDQDQSAKKIRKSELGILLIHIGLVDFTLIDNGFVVKNHMIKNCYNTNSPKDYFEQEQATIKYTGNGIWRLLEVEKQTGSMLNELLGQWRVVYEIGLIKQLQTAFQK